MGFGSIVPIPEFRQVFPGSGENAPYFLALRHTIINMAYAAHTASKGNPDISIVCEESKATSGKAYEVYLELKHFSGWKWGRSLAGFSATGTKRLMALQAADLMAREAFKHAHNLGVRKTRKPVKELHNRISFHLWTKQALEYLRDNGGADNLPTLTGWAQGSIKPPSMIRFTGAEFDLS